MNFVHDKRHKKEKGKSFLLKRRSAEPVGVISFLHSYPLSLATLDSSPKGTPYGNAGNFVATAKSRPLGEGGIAAGDDGRGTSGQAALHLSRKLSRHAKGPILEDDFPRPGEDVTAGDQKGNLSATNGSRLGKFVSRLHPQFPRHTEFTYNATFTCQTIVFFWKVLYTCPVKCKYRLPKYLHI